MQTKVQPRGRANLRVRLFLLIFLALWPAIILAYFSASQQSVRSRATVQQQALQLAQLAASNQGQLVAAAQQLLLVLSQLPVVQNGDVPACNQLFSKLRQQYQSYTNFYSVDAKGNQVCSGLLDAPPVNVAKQEWFMRAMQTKGFSVSDYNLGIVSRLPIITFSYPILDSAGNIKYQIGVGLNLNWVNEFVEKADLEPNSSILALDREGTILYRYPELSGKVGTQWATSDTIQTITSQQTGIVEAVGADGTLRLYGFAPLDNANGSAYVLVGIPSASAYGEANILLGQNLLELAAVGVLMLIIAWYGVNRILAKPVDVVVRSTRQLAQGDLTTRVELQQVSNIGEIQELASNFNDMAASLQQAHDDLEMKVEERTTRLAFLSEASALLSTSLDYKETLDKLIHLAVPRLADGCFVDILQADESIKRVAAAHIDPGQIDVLYEANRRFPLNLNSNYASAKVIRSGESELVRDASPNNVEAYAQNEDHLKLLREIAARSYMNVPLTARGRAFGAIAFCSTTPNRFTADDLSLAQELAHRASLAIDNAQLFETERHAVAEAESAIRNRDEFLSVAAHELKTPVTSVLGFSQMLLRQIGKGQMPDEQRLTHVLKNLESQNQKLAQLINQLLDVSRINGGQLVVDPKPTNIVTLVKGVAQIAQENTDDRQVIVNESAEYIVPIDPIRIEQVMTNLIDNAIKYSPDGGPIHVDIDAADLTTLRVSVTDHGVGVPAEQRQNLFQKFYRADTGRYFQGIGLGLYICRQIVELHGGVLSAEFPDTGGTRIVMCLPLSPHE